MSLPEEECKEKKKKKKVEKERGEALLLWHRKLAQRLQLEEWTRCRCNDDLIKQGFAPVPPKKAARFRDAGVEEGMCRDEILARVWYAMSSWRSKFVRVLSVAK
jgi:hypothetical protein